MSKSKIINTSLGIFVMPPELDDIYPFSDMVKEIGHDSAEEVFKSLEAINEVVYYDDHCGEFFTNDSEFAHQIIQLSYSIIKSKTHLREEFIKEFEIVFGIDNFLEL